MHLIQLMTSIEKKCNPYNTFMQECKTNILFNKFMIFSRLFKYISLIIIIQGQLKHIFVN